MSRILEDISMWPIEKRRTELERIYKEKIGVSLNLDNPQRFTEKTQWRKLYENDPRITRCINKLTFKQYVREKLGDGYTAPLIDVWHSPNDVEINGLPDKCVIKSNCSGAGKNLIMCFDKKKLDSNVEDVIKKEWFNRLFLHTNSFFSAYYPIVPCVIVEKMLSDIVTGVDEYKFLCFDGMPCYVFHADKRFDNHGILAHPTLSFFDLEWNNLGIRYGVKENNPNARRPVYMSEMITICKKLAEDFSFVRIDFYETDNQIYLSEMTFTIDGGMIPFMPDEFDFELGQKWNLRLDNIKVDNEL